MENINHCTKTKSVLNVLGPLAKHINDLKYNRGIICSPAVILSLLKQCDSLETTCNNFIRKLKKVEHLSDSKFTEIEEIASIINISVKGLTDSTRDLHRGDVRNIEEVWSLVLNYLEELFRGLMKALLMWDQTNLNQIYTVLDRFNHTVILLKNQKNINDLLQTFQDAINNIGDLFSLLSERSKDICNKFQKWTLNILCLQLHSLCTILSSILVNCIVHPHSKPFKTTRNFVLAEIARITEELRLQAGLGLSSYDMQIPGLFINTVDEIFDLIKPYQSHSNERLFSTPKKSYVQLIKEPLELVLKYSVGLAHCCSKQDNDSIMNSCENVLHQLKVLAECEKNPKSDSVDIEVTLEVVSDVLEILEMRVNMSVIRLIVQVFADPFITIDEILCLLKMSRENSQDGMQSKMARLIRNFENELDTICQIGYFTIACTTDEDRSQKIECSLGTMEWLESILIPSIINTSKEPTTDAYANVITLSKLWIAEIVKFRNIIDLSTDQSAFCLVAKQEVHQIWAQFKETLEIDEELENHKELVHRVICFVRRILTLDRASLFLYDSSRMEIKTSLNELKKYEELMNQTQLSKEERKSVLKRLQLVLTILSRLAINLNQDYLLQSECEEIIYGHELKDKLPQMSDTQKKALLSSQIEDIPVDYSHSKVNLPFSVQYEKFSDEELNKNVQNLRLTPKSALKDKSLKIHRRAHSEEILAKISEGAIKRQLFPEVQEKNDLSENFSDTSIDITKFLLSRSTFRTSARGSKRNFSLKVKEINMDISDILNIKSNKNHFQAICQANLKAPTNGSDISSDNFTEIIDKMQREQERQDQSDKLQAQSYAGKETDKIELKPSPYSIVATIDNYNKHIDNNVSSISASNLQSQYKTSEVTGANNTTPASIDITISERLEDLDVLRKRLLEMRADYS